MSVRGRSMRVRKQVRCVPLRQHSTCNAHASALESPDLPQMWFSTAAMSKLVKIIGALMKKNRSPVYAPGDVNPEEYPI